jgi:type II secretory ATPase GspE/PulE/Tfp pilus assembly ATPase PilB-like protein
MENATSTAGELLRQETSRVASLVELLREKHSIVEVVNKLIHEADRERSSDIHIDPAEHHVRVRLRIDGVLVDRFSCAQNMHNEIISRIKVLAGLRTDEHQAAQDGRFRVAGTDGRTIDVRVSITPTYHGENAVLRLLGDKSQQFTLESLGFSESDREKIERAIKRPYGMILSTGPTGSGKTTTLYTLIHMLSTPEVSIITIEDPIECAVDGISQIQINPRTGLTFANGLRSILRQDPNIIMVGEIRDAETAGIAVNSALTGHLLLSTLHTNDAATTLPRLLDMGIDPYLVASTVNIAVGQRLIRRICKDCKEEYKLTDGEFISLRALLGNRVDRDMIFHKGKGCETCGGSGYKGRIVLAEVFVVNHDIHEAILKKESSVRLKEIAVAGGMTTMLEDGFIKATQGKTTVAEILRTINE